MTQSTKTTIKFTALMVTLLAYCSAINANEPMNNSPGANNQTQTRITVGLTSIKIPNPTSGYVPAKQTFSDLVTQLEQMSRVHTVHELYVKAGTTQQSAAWNGLPRHLSVQTTDEIQYRHMPGYAFEQVKDEMKSVLRNRSDALSDDASYLSGVKVDLNKGTDRILVDEKNLFAMAMETSIGTGFTKQKRVGAVGMCLVKGKMIEVTVYSDYRSPQDAKWVKETTVKWLREIVKANS